MTPEQAIKHYGSITKAARALGIPYTTFRRNHLGTEKPQRPHDESRPLTGERLRGLLEYEPDTGMFLWRASRGKRRAFSEAGCVNAHGYVVIRIDNKLYRRNRLAWLYMTGDWPDEFVDHKNGDQSDDRWANLRAASAAENVCNQKQSKRRSHSRKGVWFESGPGRRKRWGAKISANGKQIHLGRFDSEVEAHAAYAAASAKHHGDFARTE